jgi:hypothetical protein
VAARPLGPGDQGGRDRAPPRLRPSAHVRQLRDRGRRSGHPFGAVYDIKSRGPLGGQHGTLFRASGDVAEILGIAKIGRLLGTRHSPSRLRSMSRSYASSGSRKCFPNGKRYEISELARRAAQPRLRTPTFCRLSAVANRRLTRKCLLRGLMRMRGLEPPRGLPHTDLNRARLPIPPHPRAGTQV